MERERLEKQRRKAEKEKAEKEKENAEKVWVFALTSTTNREDLCALFFFFFHNFLIGFHFCNKT